MYLMVKLDLDRLPGINSDLEFSQSLIKEQSVFCLPASVRNNSKQKIFGHYLEIHFLTYSYLKCQITFELLSP